MKNREFRELQVSSTQLAIIFFGILIIGVVIFLLGVSVGKKHAQAALKTTTVLAQKAPEQVKDRLVIPEARKDAESPAAVAHPAPAEKGSQSPARSEAPAPKTPDAIPAKENSPAPAAKPLTAAPKPQVPTDSAKPEAGVETPISPRKGLYYVQVGALAQREEAEAVSRKFKSQGYSVVVLDPQPTDRKPVYRVRVGGFASKNDADSARTRLASSPGGRPDYFIVRD